MVAVYRKDRARILRRAKLIAKTPSVAAVMAADRALFVRAVAEIFQVKVKDKLEAEVLAGVAVAILVAAVEHWTASKGARPLGEVVKLAFSKVQL